MFAVSGGHGGDVTVQEMMVTDERILKVDKK